MTSMLNSTSMYTHGAVQFRDPFRKDTHADSQSQTHHTRPSWGVQSQYTDLNRVLTPPPDMNAPNTTVPVCHQRENGYNLDHSSNQFRQIHSNICSPANIYKSAAYNEGRPLSPCPSRAQTYSRRGSQQNNIAVQYQIPRTINDSGGSISELAAEITCLFWFESSELLQEIEDGPFPSHPNRPLVPDSKPSTGFRKWVTTMISTTLVGRNVVLLALLFIRRLKKLNPGVKGKPGSEFRLLTVALMLGNKFLDDNTYTNKTWAEVSGINVAEVHIMEVEFLSNMKYCLFTSKAEWDDWMSLLGKYADFIERASRPHPPPTLPPPSSLNLPVALPSPPVSNFASPPETAGYPLQAPTQKPSVTLGPTPAPSPMAALPNWQTSQPNPRKRSIDDQATEPAAKRIATSQPQFSSPRHQAIAHRMQPVPRLPLPSLQIPPNQTPPGIQALHPPSQGHQLPPLQVPNRSMATVYPTSLPGQASQAEVLSMPSSQMHSQQPSRQQSPYPTSSNPSPTNNAPRSAVLPHPSAQISPSYYLQQRNSPYRPIHNVSTLLYPPPSAALQHRPQNVELNRMHYQPLGRPTQRQSGRLPHVPYNLWSQGMTPTAQWHGLAGNQPQQPLSQPRA